MTRFHKILVTFIFLIVKAHAMDPVFFSAARHAHFGPVSHDTTVVFDVADINVGDGYDTATGVFTAPCDGYYEFSWALRSDEEVGVWTHLYVNDQINGQMFTGAGAGSHHWTSGSFVKMLQLTASDKVMVVLYTAGGKSLFCDPRKNCVFQGKLLYKTKIITAGTCGEQ